MAQDQLGFYLSCPGDREWWRIGVDEAGETAGFAIPSATPYTRNVGYLGVLPQHRGKGLVDELLAYVTTLHHAAGASRITATTDAENNPMAEAFRRHGYRNVEIRLDFEAPVGSVVKGSGRSATRTGGATRLACTKYWRHG